MDALKSWAVSVIISALAGTVVSLLMPKGSMEKTMRSVIGVFMVAAVCLPLAQINIENEAQAVFSASGFEENNAQEIQAFLASEYESMVKEVIYSAAKETGVTDYEVIADISYDENGCIIIHEIAVEFGEDNSVSKDAFEALVNERLGFSVTVRKGN